MRCGLLYNKFLIYIISHLYICFSHSIFNIQVVYIGPFPHAHFGTFIHFVPFASCSALNPFQKVVPHTRLCDSRIMVCILWTKYKNIFGSFCLKYFVINMKLQYMNTICAGKSYVYVEFYSFCCCTNRKYFCFFQFDNNFTGV